MQCILSGQPGCADARKGWFVGKRDGVVKFREKRVTTTEGTGGERRRLFLDRCNGDHSAGMIPGEKSDRSRRAGKKVFWGDSIGRFDESLRRKISAATGLTHCGRHTVL